MKNHKLKAGTITAAALALILGAVAPMTAFAETSSAEAPASEEASTKTGSYAGKKFALVTKSMGNPYNDCMADGFKQIIEAAGGECIICQPLTATADDQIPEIDSLISQQVDVIALAADDSTRLTEILTQAADAGIKICTVDSDTPSGTRSLFCNQSDEAQIGKLLMEAVYEITGGEGTYAILSAGINATNQNAWIDAMKKEAESNGKYSSIALVDVVYGNDDTDLSASKTAELLEAYPDLDVICAPTTVGLTAACSEIQQEGASVKVTGLGLPSQTSTYIDAGICPFMYLWNPVELGKLAASASLALSDGTLTGAEGETLETPLMESGPYTVSLSESGASQIILEDPVKFDAGNIVEWADIL